jgi:integrase/recombinase XerD
LIDSCRCILAELGTRLTPAGTGQDAVATARPCGATALEKALEAFLDSLRAQSYSRATIRNRRWPLLRFSAWCAGRNIRDVRDVTSLVLTDYQRTIVAQRKANGGPLAVSTRRFLLEPLWAFFGWLAKLTSIPTDPTHPLQLPRQGRALPRAILTTTEVEAIMKEPDVRSAIGLRDRAILETLYSTGIRRAELCGLAAIDLDRERRTLMIREGKGRKDRVVPVGERALGWIARYLDEARPRLLDDNASDALFVAATHGGLLAPNTLSRIALDYRRRAGVTKGASCHIFRHTMATLMLENGADLRSLQEILGHARLQTTALYTQVSIRRLRDVHARTHPAERGRATRRTRAVRDSPHLPRGMDADS